MATEFVNTAVAAGKTTGTTKATGQIQEHFSPQAIADRATARTVKEQRDQQLAQAQATRPTEEDHENMASLQSEELRVALQQARNANNQLAKTRSYDAFMRYNADGDTRHLNNMITDLSENSSGSRIVADVTRFEQITENDAELLQDFGVSWEEFSQHQELRKGFIKTILKDGSEGILPLDMLYSATGYDRYQQVQELEIARERAEIMRLAQARTRAGNSQPEREALLATNLDRPEDIPEGQWTHGNPEFDARYLENLREAKTSSRAGTRQEREAVRQAELNPPPGIDEAEWGPNHPDFDAEVQRQTEMLRRSESRTSGMREMDRIREVKQEIRSRVENIEGAEDFFDIDFSDRRNRLRFEEDVQEIMRLGDQEISNQDRQSINHIRELLELGDTASDITSRETGLIDSTVRGFARYLSDNAEGLAATSAYTTFRNTLQHALFGSALTGNEIQMMARQFGTLRQQQGPVLQQFQTALEQVKAKLDSVAQLGDSYVSHFYLGQDRDRVETMIQGLEESIDRVQSYRRDGTGSDDPIRTDEVARPGSPEATGAGGGADLDSLYNDIFGGAE